MSGPDVRLPVPIPVLKLLLNKIIEQAENLENYPLYCRDNREKEISAKKYVKPCSEEIEAANEAAYSPEPNSFAEVLRCDFGIDYDNDQS